MKKITKTIRSFRNEESIISFKLKGVIEPKYNYGTKITENTLIADLAIIIYYNRQTGHSIKYVFENFKRAEKQFREMITDEIMSMNEKK